MPYIVYCRTLRKAGIIEFVHVEGVNNKSDILTKPFGPAEFKKQRNRISHVIDWEDDRPLHEDYSIFVNAPAKNKTEKMHEKHAKVSKNTPDLWKSLGKN